MVIFLFVTQPSDWISWRKHYFHLSPLTTNVLFPSTLVSSRHQGDKSIRRKWRDNEEIIWENGTHQLPRRRRKRLEELLVKGWTGRGSWKLTGSKEKNAAAGRREGRGKHGGTWRGWVSSWKRLISAVWNKTHSSGDEHGFQLHVDVRMHHVNNTDYSRSTRLCMRNNISDRSSARKWFSKLLRKVFICAIYISRCMTNI